MDTVQITEEIRQEPILTGLQDQAVAETTIVVENQTLEELIIVLFFKDSSQPGGNITPWKIFPLKPLTLEKRSKGTASYKHEIEVAAKRSSRLTRWGDMLIGDLEVASKVEPGDIFEYTLSDYDAIDLSKKDGKEPNAGVRTENHSGESVNLELRLGGTAVYKNRLPNASTLIWNYPTKLYATCAIKGISTPGLNVGLVIDFDEAQIASADANAQNITMTLRPRQEPSGKYLWEVVQKNSE
ncbi:MAG TPA: hypothetical protein V6D15_22105 [Oculatellaceae cyanobacterium]|jgi:hypothetical protein